MKNPSCMCVYIYIYIQNCKVSACYLQSFIGWLVSECSLHIPPSSCLNVAMPCAELSSWTVLLWGKYACKSWLWPPWHEFKRFNLHLCCKMVIDRMHLQEWRSCGLTCANPFDYCWEMHGYWQNALARMVFHCCGLTCASSFDYCWEMHGYWQNALARMVFHCCGLTCAMSICWFLFLCLVCTQMYCR